MSHFTPEELDILRQLYDGRWFVISDHPLARRHQALPDSEYEAVARAVGMQIIHTRNGGLLRVREAAPDDPIYRRGFVIGGRRKR